MSVKISITGVLGSGKSAVCKELEKFDLKYFSTGVMQRQLAVEKGMTTLELNEYSETHPEIDEMIDSKLCKLSDSPDGMVIDSRMAWRFVKDTFKVFLWADETVAAQRIINSERGLSEKYADINQAAELLKARKASENVRFKEKYGVDCGDLFNYDLVIDNTDILPELTAEVIMDYCLHRNPVKKGPVFLISPRCLYPTAPEEFFTSDFFAENFGGEKKLHPDSPVKIICAGGYLFIYDGADSNLNGHRNVYEFCKSNKPRIINCELTAQYNEFIDNGKFSFNLNDALAWEKLNGFKYVTYP